MMRYPASIPRQGIPLQYYGSIVLSDVSICPVK